MLSHASPLDDDLAYLRPPVRLSSPPPLSSAYDDAPLSIPSSNHAPNNANAKWELLERLERRKRPLPYINAPIRLSSSPPPSQSDYYRTFPLPSPHLPLDEDENSAEEQDKLAFEFSSDDSFSSNSTDHLPNEANEDDKQVVADQDADKEEFVEQDDPPLPLPALPHDEDEDLETEEQYFSSFESSNDASFCSSRKVPFNWPFPHNCDGINTSFAALQIPPGPPSQEEVIPIPLSRTPTSRPSSPASFILTPKFPPIEVSPAGASPPPVSLSSLPGEDFDATLHHPFPPSAIGIQPLPEAVSPSHILSPEPASVDASYSATFLSTYSEEQDANFPTGIQRIGRPVSFKGNADGADTSMDTSCTPDDSQYDSNYVQFDNSRLQPENFHDGYASKRVHSRSGSPLTSERVAHWSGSSGRSVASDTSSIVLPTNVPMASLSSVSLTDSNRSCTPPLVTYHSSNQTHGLPPHSSHMLDDGRQSFDRPRGPSPAPSVSGFTQKTYSLSSNASYTSTTSLPYTPHNLQPQSQPPMSTHNLLSQAHLKPGDNASLLSYKKTLEMYRMQARKMSGDLEIQFEFATFLVGLGGGSAKLSIEEGDENGNEEEHLAEEGCRILKKLSAQGHAASQYYLATCYINGLGSSSGYKPDWAKAFPLLQKASKHNHPDAAYLVARCYAAGKGVKRDGSRALQYYKKSAAAAHPGAMYALGMAFLTGNLAVLDSTSMIADRNGANQVASAAPPLPIRPAPKDGVKWLKRACESATPDFSDALFELAKLHEQGIDNVVFVDLPYAVSLYTRAAELGHVRSMYRLGECYEFGKLGCELDPRRSVAWYRAAAENEHPDSCFAMTAWYLSGHPGVVPQSGAEAFRWALKAAEKGHPKATYATAYFMETGMGVEKDMESALKWYKIAADLGDSRAVERLAGTVPRGAQGKYGKDGSERRRRKGDDCAIM